MKRKFTVEGTKVVQIVTVPYRTVKRGLFKRRSVALGCTDARAQANLELTAMSYVANDDWMPLTLKLDVERSGG